MRDVQPMDARRRTVTAWLAASVLIVAVVAACGGSTSGEATNARPDGDTGPPAASPTTASPAGPAAPRDLEALADSFAPPTGEARPSTTNDAMVIKRWITTESVDALEAHYERIADDADFVLVGTSTGTITTWILAATDESVNGSIQVAPEPGAGLIVTVTLSLAR